MCLIPEVKDKERVFKKGYNQQCQCSKAGGKLPPLPELDVHRPSLGPSLGPGCARRPSGWVCYFGNLPVRLDG